VDAKEKGYSNTPLHTAVQYSSVKVVKVLLENGADVNAPAWYHETPLHHAVRTGNISIIKMLLKYNANINALSSCWGCETTPFSLAIEREKNAIVTLFVEKILETNDTGSMNNMAWDYSSKKPDLALKLSKRSLEIEPRNPYYLHTLAEIYFHLKDLKASKARLEEARKYADENDHELTNHIKDLAERIAKASREMHKE
jgi:tetratricopeptide (TPR) repeat protein